MAFNEIVDDYDWEKYADNPYVLSADKIKNIALVDEGARDGLGSALVHPSAEDLLRYIAASEKLGIDQMTVGIFPGPNNNEARKRMNTILCEMHSKHPNVTPIVLSMPTEESLAWTGECVKLNPKVTAIVFKGTAAYRMWVHDWTEEEVLRDMAYYISETRKQGVRVIGGTEHTTQTNPEFLEKIIKTQVKNGADIFCIADTIGIATPGAVYNIVSFARKILNEMGRSDVKIDWHGHRDLNNDLANAYAALAAGADRIHVVSWGQGERAGNTALESVLVNLHRIFIKGNLKSPWDIRQLFEVLKIYSEITGIPTPHQGMLGDNAFKTEYGIHADAMYKAYRHALEARTNGDIWKAEDLEKRAHTIYSALDPTEFGLENIILVGPLSGKSNVLAALDKFGFTNPNEKLIKAILHKAQSENRILSPEELYRFVRKALYDQAKNAVDLKLLT